MSKTFSPSVTVEFLNRLFLKNQLPENFGITFSGVGADFIQATLTVDDRHLRPGNIMNGGVSLVLIETVGSISAACLLDHEKENALGIQVNASHLTVANPGDILTATSKPIHIGRSTHLWEVNIENQNKKIVCSGRITLLIVKK